MASAMRPARYCSVYSDRPAMRKRSAVTAITAQASTTATMLTNLVIALALPPAFPEIAFTSARAEWRLHLLGAPFLISLLLRTTRGFGVGPAWPPPPRRGGRGGFPSEAKRSAEPRVGGRVSESELFSES